MQVEGKWQAVLELSQTLADFTPLLRYFRNKILPDGTLDDRASPELARIRREMEKQKRAIQESLRSYLRRLSDGGAVQEELVTIRGERFVIPVKVEQRRRVQGVAHGASSSGQTVFIEPLETIEQNNELVRLLEEEQAEIHRILLEMTARLGEHADALQQRGRRTFRTRVAVRQGALCRGLRLRGGEAAAGRDAAEPGHHSPACLRSPHHRSMGASDTASCDALVLRNARHPLLERTLKPKGVAVVPLTVELDSQHRQLIISGPNTGGKTVALKTIGLLALMAQSGIPVPAERAELPIFDSVFADIGDYQSIEQNLSTFSAHVTNIDFISHQATRAFAGAARRAGLGHRSRRRRRAGGGHCRLLPARGMHQHRLHPPHRAEGLRGQHAGRAQRRRRLRRAHPGSHVRAAHRRARRVGGHQHRAKARTESGDRRRRRGSA